MHISDDEFERAIEQVLDDLPERFARVLENVGIVVADALLGEITPAMATAVCQSHAMRVLIPVNHCENYIVGVPEQPISDLVAAAVQKVKALCAGEGCGKRVY